MAIKLGLEAIINESDYGELWILSDSRSSFNIYTIDSSRRQNKHLYPSQSQTYFKASRCSFSVDTIPCDIFGIAPSKVNRQLSKEWKILPSHHWYAAREQGSFWISTATEHLKRPFPDWLVDTRKSLLLEGRKTFKFCSKCKVQQASAEHILDCLGLSREDLYDSPPLVIDFLRVNNLMDLVRLRQTIRG
ncbi:RNase H domain-containing protein [Trichonephila clavipes]|nr:RNase H domain-containing protein [Trichonephila clavipes]